MRKRYCKFNVYYRGGSRFCEKGFPSWVDKWDYPLIFWEPSNEQQIQMVVKTFMSEKCKRPAKHNNLSWVAIATNLDPEMFQTYMSSYDGQFPNKKWLLQNTTGVMLSRLTVDGKDLIIMSSKVNGQQLLQVRSGAFEVLKELTLKGSIKTLRAEGDTLLITFQDETGTYSQVYNTNL